MFIFGRIKNKLTAVLSLSRQGSARYEGAARQFYFCFS